MGLGEKLRARVGGHVSRKMVHVSAGSWIWMWRFFNPSHWAWRLNILIPAVYSLELIYRGLINPDPNHKLVQKLSRSGDPIELIRGPLMFSTLMCVVGLGLFQRAEGATIMAVLGWGDGLSSLFGQRFGKLSWRYRTPFGQTKSLIGSVSCFLGSLLGMMVFRFALGTPGWSSSWLLFAVIGTLVEAVSPPEFDNLLMPAAVHAVELLLRTPVA
eukprot:jgi/Bigna1/84877/estExt_fgenesh1_pg.C_10267